jgi:hypothetical protein
MTTEVALKKFAVHVNICHNPMAKITTWVADDLFVRAVDERHAKEKLQQIAERRGWWIAPIFISEDVYA